MIACLGYRWTRWNWMGFQVGVGENPEMVPKGAALWLAKHRPPGRLFNTLGESGYLAFRLYPTYQLFIDGFTDYPLHLFQAALAISNSSDPTPALDSAGIGIVVLGAEAGVFGNLAQSLERIRQRGGKEVREWVPVYADGVSSVYLRNVPQYAALIERWGYRAVRVATARPIPGLESQARAEVERIRREGMPSAARHVLTGVLSERLGDLARAEADYRTAVARVPYPVALIRLARLLEQRAEREEAARLRRKVRGAAPPALLEDYSAAGG